MFSAVPLSNPFSSGLDVLARVLGNKQNITNKSLVAKDLITDLLVYLQTLCCRYAQSTEHGGDNSAGACSIDAVKIVS